MKLRDNQQTNVQEVLSAFEAGAQNVLDVFPTGGGKTVIESWLIKHFNQPTCIMAHRKELVGQIALALARNGVQHKIIGPKDGKLIKGVVNIETRELGTHFYHPNSSFTVASVDSLLSQKNALKNWAHQQRWWMIDEGHHVLRKNKWGKVVNMFPNARGIGFTATPCRADGNGLGRHAAGVYDKMIVGPSPRALINEGWLTDYRIFAPPSDLDMSKVSLSADGDFNKRKTRRAVRSSTIIGDVVEKYLEIAPGKLAVVFADSIENANDITKNFQDTGIRAEMVHSKTPDTTRDEIVRRFRERELDVLVNVDLFGEGFDLPAVEVVIMVRPTQSYALYCQQFGRALRIMDGKNFAIIIDHVGNVVRHGLPDKLRQWTLDSRERQPRCIDPDDNIPLRYCPECTSPYERILLLCPYCGHKPIPASRSKPEFVDGDLYELDPKVLTEMRGEIDLIDNPQATVRKMKFAGASLAAINGYRKKAAAKCEMQTALRESISWWAAYQQQQGRPDAESYRLFYHTFGIDVMSAQCLGRPDALVLANQINERLGVM